MAPERPATPASTSAASDPRRGRGRRGRGRRRRPGAGTARDDSLRAQPVPAPKRTSHSNGAARGDRAESASCRQADASAGSARRPGLISPPAARPPAARAAALAGPASQRGPGLGCKDQCWLQVSTSAWSWSSARTEPTDIVVVRFVRRSPGFPDRVSRARGRPDEHLAAVAPCRCALAMVENTVTRRTSTEAGWSPSRINHARLLETRPYEDPRAGRACGAGRAVQRRPRGAGALTCGLRRLPGRACVRADQGNRSRGPSTGGPVRLPPAHQVSQWVTSAVGTRCPRLKSVPMVCATGISAVWTAES